MSGIGNQQYLGIVLPANLSVGAPTWDQNSNVGIGVAPSAGSGRTNLELGYAGSSLVGSQGDLSISSSAYYAGGWKNAEATYRPTNLDISDGVFTFRKGSAAAIGTAITWATAMVLDASGRLGIGLTSPSYILDVGSTSTSNTININGTASVVRLAGSSYGQIASTSTLYLDAGSGQPVVFRPNGSTEAARIDSSGNLLIGTTTVPSGTTPRAVITQAATDTTTFFQQLSLLQTTTVSANRLWTFRTSGGGDLRLSYSVEGSYGTFNDRLAIDSSGNFSLINGSADFVRTGSTATPFRIMNIGQVSNSRNVVIFDANYASGNSTDLWFTKNSSSSYIWRLMVDSPANGSTNFSYASSAGGSYGVQLSSNTATSWSANSDIRLKDVIGHYTSPLDDIAQIEAIKFTWKGDETKKPCVGVSAQSVLPVVPEAIEYSKHVDTDDDTEYMTVRYTELIPLMIASIQALTAEIQTLKAKA